MAKYEILKGAGKTMWMVRDGEDVMRFYTKGQCEAWIKKAEKADVEKAEYKKTQYAARLEDVTKYLAIRAARKAEAAQQLEFNF